MRRRPADKPTDRASPQPVSPIPPADDRRPSVSIRFHPPPLPGSRPCQPGPLVEATAPTPLLTPQRPCRQRPSITPHPLTKRTLRTRLLVNGGEIRYSTPLPATARLRADPLCNPGHTSTHTLETGGLPHTLHNDQNLPQTSHNVMAPTAHPDGTPRQLNPPTASAPPTSLPSVPDNIRSAAPSPETTPRRDASQGHPTNRMPTVPTLSHSTARPTTPARPRPGRASPSAGEMGNPRDPPAPALGDYDAAVSPPYEPH